MAAPAIVERSQLARLRGVEEVEGVVEDGELLGNVAGLA